MADLTRIDASQSVEITDGVSQTVTVNTSLPGSSDAGLTVREARQGQTTMSGSVPIVIASDQSAVPISGTVTLSSNTVTLSSQTVTVLGTGTAGTAASGVVTIQGIAGGTVVPISGTVTLNSQTVTLSSYTVTVASGTITTVPSGTQNVTGTVTLSSQTITTVPSGTRTIIGTGTAGTAASGVVTVQGIAGGVAQPISGTVTLSSNTVTLSSQTVTTVPSGTQTVDTELPTAAALADAASATPTTPTVGAIHLLMNATTVDRQRAVVNSLNTTGTGIAAAGLVAQLDDASTSTVTENQFAPVRLSSRRALLVEGVASGTAQPISGTVTLSSNTVTLSSSTVTLSSQTVTTVPSGTRTIIGTGTAGTAASGVVTIQGIAGGTAVIVNGSAVTQPVSGTVTLNSNTVTVASGSVSVVQGTAANLNATVIGSGTAGTAASGVVTIQGIASMTAITVKNITSTAATSVSQTSVTTTASTLLTSNSSRKRFAVQNTGTTLVKLGLGATPTSTAYHVCLAACTASDDGTGGFYLDEMWAGSVVGICSGAGTIVITELT